MPRTCLACRKPEAELESINRRLIEGKETIRQIAQTAGLSPASIERHKKRHLGKRLSQGLAAQRALREGDRILHGALKREECTLNSLLDQVASLEGKAERAWTRAMAEGDVKTAVSAIRESARLLELKARLAGELRPAGSQERGNVNVQVLNVGQSSRSDAEIERDCRLALSVLEDEKRDRENLLTASPGVQVQEGRGP